MGDRVNGRSPKNLESLIEDPNVVHVNVRVQSFNMILISTHRHGVVSGKTFGYDLGHKVKVSSPKKPKNLIEVP